MKKNMITAALLLLSLSLILAFAKGEENKEPGGILVPIVNAKGEEIGSARLTQQGKKVLLDVEAKGLPPGTHGIHFHNVGKCDPPDFKTAGDHFNPTVKQHGFKNPKGFHSGDLPNIVVKEDGTVQAKLESAVVSLERGKPNSLLKEGGAAIVIHEKADDYVTDPSGNSGSRIACGIIS
ncbi:superoxide dismutase family protein [Paenibacillus sp. GCM10027627]|uniref:superoxide dismutase family protein n=1 Tax=unclassified Paenibacillus TaxID=185978 RepID=UPI00363A6942